MGPHNEVGTVLRGMCLLSSALQPRLLGCRYRFFSQSLAHQVNILSSSMEYLPITALCDKKNSL